MVRKTLGCLLVLGSVGIVFVAIAMFRRPDAGVWQVIGPLFLAAMFLYQGVAYLSKAKRVTENRVTGLNRVQPSGGDILNKLKSATPGASQNSRLTKSAVPLLALGIPNLISPLSVWPACAARRSLGYLLGDLRMETIWRR
jgi:hypothetical protein